LTSWSKTASRSTRSTLGRHGDAVVEPRSSSHQHTFLAISGNHYFPIVAALENGFQAIEAQSAFGTVLAVASQTGRFEQGPDVLAESQVLFLRWRRQLAHVELADVPFFIRLC
jgi:hypothetical protein